MDEEVTAIGRLRRIDDQGGDDSFGYDHQLALDAAVIEEGALGTFRRIAGIAASGVDAVTGRFDMDVAPGQGFGTGTALTVQLFEQSRLFNRQGDELDRADIAAEQGTLADGVLAIGTEDLLRSPLVIVDSGVAVDVTQMEGEVVFVDSADQSLIVFNGTADRCVDAAAAEVFLINTSDGFTSTRIDSGDLRPGQAVSMFGREAVDGCFRAATILAEDD